MPPHSEPDLRYTQDRELSWLKFDLRVLEEAADPQVPLFERLKFAAIFTGNLDQFFMVRVGRLEERALEPSPRPDCRSGLLPRQQLAQVLRAIRPMYGARDRLVFRLETALRAAGIARLDPGALSGRELEQVERYARERAVPLLSPVVVDSRHPLPPLPGKGLAAALALRRKGRDYLGLVPIPACLPPFLVLGEAPLRYILMEQVVLSQARLLFPGYALSAGAIIAVTRAAGPDRAACRAPTEDFPDHMRHLLRQCSHLRPVRLEVQGELPEHTLARLGKLLGLPEERVFFARAPLSMEYVFPLEKLLPESSHLRYPPSVPQWPAGLDENRAILPQVLGRDILLAYPYQAMDPFLRLVREAAADPQVVSIKITIYRLGPTSRLAEYLAEAAENGKEVTVFMELLARFDEDSNLRWAERLERAGCALLYGAEGFKVHAKLCLITRREGDGVRHVTQIGTGNYNEKTAGQYADLCLLTAHPGLGRDAAAFFRNLATGSLAGRYRYLLAAPHTLRGALLDLIDAEIAKGPEGFIFLKVNAVTDRRLIDKLSQASRAGVRVLMNVRGICCLRPGVEGLTDHIRVFSIVGRFLEHARIFIFGKGEDAKMYLSSADLMTRNTRRRVELACPILDPEVRRQVAHYVEVLCADTRKARRLDSQGNWVAGPRRLGRAAREAQAVFLAEAAEEGPSLP